MKKKACSVFGLTAALLLVTVFPASILAATGDPVINEFVFNHTGTDFDEFVEIFGTQNTDYSAFTVLEVEGDGSGAGVIDGAFPVGVTDVGGFWTTGFFGNVIENGTVTLLLVEDFSGGVGDDLDADNDGVLDSTPWTRLVDEVAVTDGGSSDRNYSPVVLGPFFDGNPFGAGGASRIPNGSDTDSISDWVRNDFDGAGLPSFPGVQAAPGEAINTPGLPNLVATTSPTVLTIPEIQGTGQFSPFEGAFVETTGVVTLITSNGRDMWIQDAMGDGLPSTSDGVFVDDRDVLSPLPKVGDLITIRGQVEEQQFGTQLPLTRIDDTQLVSIISTDNPLPTPVSLYDLPDELITESIGFWEPLEGMLVSVQNAPVVAATSGFGEFAMLTKDDAKPGSGFYPQTQQILIRSLGGEMVDYDPERILVDDSSLSEPIVVMPGDRVRSLVGVVDYTFGNYKLQPASYDVETHELPNLPASTRSGGKGDLTVTTFNVENLFDLAYNVPVVVDTIGQVGFDPGYEWGSGDTSTQNNTLRRMPSVCQGDADGTDAFDPTLEWAGFPQNTFDGLGAHAVDCGPTTELFISEYVEGSSYNKALEIYNGTGAAVNLGAEGYAIEIYFNGSSSAGNTILLAGTVADGDVFVLADPSADASILAEADQLTSGYLFNGDDAIVLRKGGKDDAGSTPTPEELEIKLSKLALAIQIELQLPEILVVQEVENQEILQVLGDRVNSAAGTAYVATSFETSDARGIEVGFLWDENRVELLDAYQMFGPDVEAAFGPGSASPGREPLVGKFEVTDGADGQLLWIVGNHFKSKSGDDALYGVNDPPIRVTEAQRKMQAQVVRDYVDGILSEDSDAWVIVTGDLNDFQFGEPGEGPDHPLAILEGEPGQVSLTNLINLEKEAERFTYVYDGNSQVLDHMLISPALLDLLEGQDALHFNASYPSDLGADPSTPLRSSDHDAFEGRFVIP